MKKVTFNHVNKWVRQSSKPLEDEALEGFQQDYFGDFLHKYYRFFYRMVNELKPKVALEIGVDHGHTLAHMAAANPGTMVIGIDKNPRASRDMPTFPNVQILHINSLDGSHLMDELTSEFGSIGVVFQDSSHHYEESHREFEIYSQFMDNNSVWCVDDVLDVFHDPLIDPPGKSMVSYFDELPGRKKLYDNLHYGSVIGVCLL